MEFYNLFQKTPLLAHFEKKFLDIASYCLSLQEKSSEPLGFSLVKIQKELANLPEKKVPLIPLEIYESSKVEENNALKEKISLKKQALNKFRRAPTLENLIEFKRRRSQCRREILEAQRNSWQQYVNTMTPEATSNDVWKKVGAISGKINCSYPTFLRNSDGTVTNKLQDITNIIGDQFYKVSSSSNYPRTFLDTKHLQ